MTIIMQEIQVHGTNINLWISSKSKFRKGASTPFIPHYDGLPYPYPKGSNFINVKINENQNDDPQLAAVI